MSNSARKIVAPGTELFPRRQAAIVALAALALRVAFWLPAHGSPFLHTPVVDGSFFDIWARTLADGKVFQAQAFFKPPLYAYLLAGLYRLGFGMQAVLALQLGVGLVTSLLTFGIGRLVFPPRTAFAGALIAAVLPMLPFFEVQLVAEAWTIALSQASLLCFLLAVRAGARRPGRLQFASGVLLGLAALGRPNLMIVVPLLGVWLWWQGRRGERLGTGAIVPLVIGVALAIAPATLHNLRYGEFVPISANLGVNLLTGSHESADGVSAIPVGVQWDGLQLRARQSGAASPSAFSSMMTREAVKWAREHPARELQLLWRKTVLLFSGYEGRNNLNPRWLSEMDGVFVLSRWWPGTWLVLPLAVGGLVFVRRNPRADLLRWLIIVQAAAILPFFVAARFRAPLLPLLALFAAAFVDRLVSLRREDRRRFGAALALLAGLMVLTNVDWYGLGGPRWLAPDHFNLALIESRAYDGRQPDPAAAERHFRRALELDPGDVDNNERFGAFLLTRAQPAVERAATLAAAGRAQEAAAAAAVATPLLDEAGRLHTHACDLYPRSHRSLANLGVCRLWQADLTAERARGGADAGAAAAALNLYAQAGDAVLGALRIDPTMSDARQTLQEIRRRVAAVPAVDAAVADTQQRLLARLPEARSGREGRP